MELCGPVFVEKREGLGPEKVIALREFACPRTQKMPDTSKGIRQFDAFVGVLLDPRQGLVGFVEVLIQYNIFEL